MTPQNLKTVLQFKHAALGYGKRPVITGVDFSIRKGAFVGILGPNGSGKTTLLKTILGLIPCIKGHFIGHGTSFGLPRYGYVPQKERLDPIYPLTAYDVAAMGTFRRVELFQGFRGLDHRDLIKKCMEDCGALQLAPKLYRDLSGGQKQRVLIARALAAEPELLVLDEPLAGIDISTQKALITLLLQIKVERNLTVLMVSHRLRVERALFTDLIWVDEGKATMGSSDEMLTTGKLSDFFKSEL